MEVHARRVADLRAMYFADDLEPPPSSSEWSDRQLTAWFEHGGQLEAGLMSLVFQEFSGNADVNKAMDSLMTLGIFTLNDLVAADEQELLSTLSVGARYCLKPAIQAEKERRRAEEAAQLERTSKAEADQAFWIKVAVRNATTDNPDEDTSSELTTVSLQPLPHGRMISVGKAGSEIGGTVWPCANLLCGYLLTDRGGALIRGSSVVELGAGTGQVGLYAAALGASQLVLTDVFTRRDGSSGELRDLLQNNINRNHTLFETCPCDVAELNFDEPAHAQAVRRMAHRGAEGFDIVIASDVTYAGIGVAFDALARTIATTLRAPDGTALICHEYRLKAGNGLASNGGDPALEDLRSRAVAAGLSFEYVHDDRGPREMAASGMRCIIRLRHAQASV